MNLALFDFDCTITATETFTGFLHFATDAKRKALGRLLLVPTFCGYRLGVVSVSTLRQHAVHAAFRGKRLDDLQRLGQRYSDDVIGAMVRPRALKRIAWHKAQGDTVVVVSASLDVYLSAWCRQHDVACICTELESREGIITGRYVAGDCIGREKSRRVLERYTLADYAAVYAYGDSDDDRAMLDLAHRRYFRWREEREPAS
jgi:HAD superfamily hydrolase (TIGR01490 family)